MTVRIVDCLPGLTVYVISVFLKLVMKLNRAQSTVATKRLAKSQRSHSWLQTASGMTILAIGLQGAAASAVGELSVDNLSAPLPASISDPDGISESAVSESAVSESAVEVAPENNTSVEPTAPQPRFAQFKNRVQGLMKPDSQPLSNSLSNPYVARLETHRRDLNRRSNEVEAQLLSVQQLLSIQSYGTSFADRLLDEDREYQVKLQQLRALETLLHTALEQADTEMLNLLNNRLQRIEQDLKQRAQLQLQQHIEQAQVTSTLGLWQEPMYRESLRWLMQHTHERYLLKARQQTLAHAFVAIAPN